MSTQSLLQKQILYEISDHGMFRCADAPQMWTCVGTWFNHGGLRQSLSQNVDTPDVESDIQGGGNGIRHLG
jgi:hypothetical protein